MATVYLALIGGDRGFRKMVALKVLRDQPGVDFAELREMFAHEARVSARCHHRNIVQIHDVCELDGKPALCMEFLDGQTYRQVRSHVGSRAEGPRASHVGSRAEGPRASHVGSRAEGPRASTAPKMGGLPLFEQVRILAEAAHGLHHVHTLTDYDGRPLGLVHCDVSPENVFVTYDGQVKLLDFGIAQAHSDRPRAPGFKGKLTYLAPELITGQPIDARADVFALGAMLWEAVSVAPFSGGPTVDARTKLRTRLAGGEANIRGVQPGAPEALAEIIDRAIALDPKQRFADAEAFACALEDYLLRAGAQPSAQSLSTLVVPMFERERAKLRAMVDPQLQLADRWDREHASSADHEQSPQVGPAPADAEARFDLPSREASAQAAIRQVSYAYTGPADTVRPESRWHFRPRGTGLALLALAAALGVLSGALIGWSDADHRAQLSPGQSPSASPSNTPGAVSAPVAAAPEPPSNSAREAGQQAASHGDPAVQVHGDSAAERSSLTSEVCVTTAGTLKEEMRRLASDLVRSQEKLARHKERRLRRRAAQCAAGRTEKC